MNNEIRSFYHAPTNTWTHVLVGDDGRGAAIVDPVLDYEARSGRTHTRSVDEVIAWVRGRGLALEWILETHAHADHLSAAPHVKAELGGRLGIGEGICKVQTRFKQIFNMHDLTPDGGVFDHLFRDGESLQVGGTPLRVMATPGHTNDSVSYVGEGFAFIGDTLFSPDYGTARCDFPGGDAAELFGSIQKLYGLGEETRLYLCHDYPPDGREPKAWFMVGEQRQGNRHVRADTAEAEFVDMRTTRDRDLALPELIVPSVQVNVRAGHMPPAEDNGTAYIKVPVNTL
jgi:glyoxylase-like metal-dependent hydrolase (beta-lactamase superfamily II)